MAALISFLEGIGPAINLLARKTSANASLQVLHTVPTGVGKHVFANQRRTGEWREQVMGSDESERSTARETKCSAQQVHQPMRHSISRVIVATMSKTTLSKPGPAKLATKVPQGVKKPFRTSTVFENRLYDVSCTSFPCSPLTAAAIGAGVPCLDALTQQ